MVQELIPGGDDELYTVGSYIAADGTVLGLFSGRKLRQSPPGIGTCRVGEAVWVQEAVDAALRLLRAFDFHGVSQVEFKRDPRDGRFKLMEVNPRFWLWHGLAAALGVDFARIAYHDLLGRPPAPVTTEGKHGRWAITLLAGERPAFQRPPYVEPVFSLDDPKPGVTQLARVVKAALALIPPRASSDAPAGSSTPSAPAIWASATVPYRGDGLAGTSTPDERPDGDDLAEAFFHFARVEERAGPRDDHGRFPASATCLDPLDPPLERLRRKLGLEPPRWGGARFAVALSHDVDIPWRWTRKGIRLGAGRLEGSTRRGHGLAGGRGLAAVPSIVCAAPTRTSASSGSSNWNGVAARRRSSS